MKILHNGKEVFVLDLGMVKIGETKEYEYTLENESKWDIIDIKLSLSQIDETEKTVDLKEVKILNYPEKLKGHKDGLLKFSWTPSIEIKSGLKAKLKIKALEVWR